MPDAVQVDLIEPERMNLLGLFVQSLLERNLALPGRLAKARKLNGRIGIQAGAMQVTLACDHGHFVLSRGLVAPLAARVVGKMEPFLKIALGDALVLPVLTGEVKISGNIFLLLRLLPLLRAPLEPSG